MEMLGFHHHKLPALQQQQAAAAATGAASPSPRAPGFVWRQVPQSSPRSASAEAAEFFPGSSEPALGGAPSVPESSWPVVVMDHDDGRGFPAGLDPAQQLFVDPHQQSQYQQRAGEGPLALSLFGSPTGRGPDAGSRLGLWPQQQLQGGAYHDQQHQQHLLAIRYSRYLVPAQDLLYECCNVAAAVESPGSAGRRKTKGQSGSGWEDAGGAPSPSSTSYQHQQAALQSMDAVELQRRKARLMIMLDEVDRRYRRYCDQMRAVVASFESVAGQGAAAAYSTLASRAMSKHFRCLKDGVVAQIRAVRKAMGETTATTNTTTTASTAANGVAVANNSGGGKQSKLPAPPETTPRLKVLDQCLRQQKLFQQGGLGGEACHPPWRPQRGLPERSVSILRAWLFEHFLHPYPSDVDKHILARQTGLSRSQVSNWFINARVRLWKPMVEEMYVEEQKEQDEEPSSSTANMGMEGISAQLENVRNANTNATDRHHPHHGSATIDENCKPDPDCLSSVVIGSHALQSNRTYLQLQQQHARYGAATGSSVNIDFSSYGGHRHQGFGNSAVSLTLGLQQQGVDGIGVSFSPAVGSGQEQVMFHSRNEMENCGGDAVGHQAGQYFSILDGDGQGMSLPYRDLMGAQLLHDLAG